jgi:hypothetical protein
MPRVINPASMKAAENRLSRNSRRLEHEPNSPVNSDALGEICNMVDWNFNSKNLCLAENRNLPLPTVIPSGDYLLHTLTPQSASM